VLEHNARSHSWLTIRARCAGVGYFREKSDLERFVSLTTSQAVMTFGTLRRWRTQSLSSTRKPRRTRKRCLHRGERAYKTSRAWPTRSCSWKILVSTHRTAPLRLIEVTSGTLMPWGTFCSFIVEAGKALGTAVSNPQGECTLTPGSEALLIYIKSYS
jgi:hypothetical protein